MMAKPTPKVASQSEATFFISVAPGRPKRLTRPLGGQWTARSGGAWGLCHISRARPPEAADAPTTEAPETPEAPEAPVDPEPVNEPEAPKETEPAEADKPELSDDAIPVGGEPHDDAQ